MSLTFSHIDFPHQSLADREETIASSPGMRNVKGILGLPFNSIKSWPELLSRESADCNGRTVCTGCSRLTKATNGCVYVILRSEGKVAVGAICSTSDPSSPYAPVYFKEQVVKK